jgi:hypothetical protein
MEKMATSSGSPAATAERHNGWVGGDSPTIKRLVSLLVVMPLITNPGEVHGVLAQ